MSGHQLAKELRSLPEYSTSLIAITGFAQFGDRNREPEIPPTAVGGLFRSNLRRTRLSETAESHQRQLVDCSDPTYDGQDSPKPQNPTNGSWWIVPIQPTTDRTLRNPRIPPTAVRGLFKSCLASQNAPCLFSFYAPHTLHKPGLRVPASPLALFSHASPLP